MQPLETIPLDDAATWVALCARRLRERWPRLHLETLEETARELMRDETLQGLAPVDAAERWLAQGISVARACSCKNDEKELP